MSHLALVFLLVLLSQVSLATTNPPQFKCKAYGPSIDKTANDIFYSAEEKSPGIWMLNKIYSNDFVLNITFNKSRYNEATVIIGKNGQVIFYTTVVMINWDDVLILAPFTFDGINISCEYPLDDKGLPL